MTGVAIPTCADCGRGLFPARLRCPGCGSERFDNLLVFEARLEETTTLLHVAGRAGSTPVRLGVVVTEAGVRLVARLARAAEPGALVTLSDDAGAIVAG
jgi:uncharacterized OB-fold protein